MHAYRTYPCTCMFSQRHVKKNKVSIYTGILNATSNLILTGLQSIWSPHKKI